MGIRIIIADDHKIVREGLGLILTSQADITVVAEVENGMEAVKKVNELNPDVVLMDITMPLMNGVEATNRIKSTHPHIHIVILSMRSSLEDIFRALNAGAIGYVVKESAGEEVVQAVRAAFHGRRFFSRKIDDLLIDSYLHEQLNYGKESPLQQLSPREREILQLVAEGKANKEIAEILFLSIKTVETYRSRMIQKMGFHTSSDLIKFALQHGFTQ